MTFFRCLCLLFILCCCNSKPKTDAGMIRVSVLRGPSAIAFAHWMKETPVIDGKPLSVRIIDSPDLMQATLIKGEADIAVLPMISAVNLYNKGIRYHLAGCPIWGTLYLAGRSDKGISGENKSVLHIFGAGTTPDILTRYYLQQHKLTILSITILILAWQLLTMLVRLPELVPSIPHLFSTLVALFASGSFYQSVMATVLRGTIGMSISLMAAMGVSLLFYKCEWIYELFRPLLAIMRSIPVISFILLALIFLNAESIPLIIAFLTMFPLLTENLTKGIRGQRKEFSIMARQFRIGRWNKLTQVVYPQLKPFLYSGLASASGFGWRAIIMGEVLAQCSPGIGGEMKQAQVFIAVPELIAWTIIAILISYLFDRGISWLAKQRFPIHYNKHCSKQPVPKGNCDIRIRDISYRYGSDTVLSHFSYTFEKGFIYGITAPSGTGKTTLLNLIGNVLKPAQGEIETDFKTGIAYVFQEPELLSQLTIAENITLPLAAYLKKEIAFEQAISILQKMELDGFENRFPNELSFGQQQRAAIARALTYPSPLLLMDEPFKGLDEALSRRIIKRIRERQTENGQTILFTSHNPGELHLFADKTVRLDQTSH